MKRTLFLVLATAFSATALADGIGLKPGLWGMSTVRQTMDGRDITAQTAAAGNQLREQAMARMTPEQRQQMEAHMPPGQRQQMEAMMGGQGGGAGAAHRVCVSASMAARDKPMIDPQGHCEANKVNHLGNKTSFEFDCTHNGVGTAGHGESTVDGDTITTRVDMTLSEPRGHHAMHSETQMKFLGKDCQGIKPLDELAKEFNGPAGNK